MTERITDPTFTSPDATPKPKTGRRWLITLFAVIALIIALAAYKALEIKAAIEFGESFPEHSETVNSERLKVVDYQAFQPVQAQVIAPQRLVLRNELPGKIAKLNFSAGEQVKAGQLLLSLDTSSEQAQLDAARARHTLAKSTWQRSQKLRKDNSVSIESFEQARADFLTTAADVRALEVVISKMQLRAPFAASAGIQQLEVGQYLPANSEITTLVGLSDSLWLDFSRPQDAFPLALGSEIRLNHRNQSLSATIIARSAEAASNTRQIAYRAAITRNEQAPLPGSVITVEVASGPVEAVFDVADTAVGQDRFGAYVYALDPEKEPDEKSEEQAFRAARLSVELLDKRDGRALIKSLDPSAPLSQGREVAALGTFKLYPQIKVYIAKRDALESGNDYNSDNSSTELEVTEQPAVIGLGE